MYQVLYIVISNHLPHFTESFESGSSLHFFMNGNFPELLTVPQRWVTLGHLYKYDSGLASDLNE